MISKYINFFANDTELNCYPKYIISYRLYSINPLSVLDLIKYFYVWFHQILSIRLIENFIQKCLC